jgi:hypothetical protein
MRFRAFKLIENDELMLVDKPENRNCRRKIKIQLNRGKIQEKHCFRIRTFHENRNCQAEQIETSWSI